jgi:hypothetical protein
MVALKRFGAVIHEWEPEMFDLEFRDEFSIDVPAVNQSKLLALTTAIATNTFYQEPHVFGVVCELLSGGEENFADITPDLLPAEMAWGVTEVLLNDSAPEAVSSDVAAYVGVILGENGFLAPPKVLDFAILPYRYQGSSDTYEINQGQIKNTEHAAVVDQFLVDQLSSLLTEIRSLPWVTSEMIAELEGDLASTSFRLTIETAVLNQVGV